MSKYLPYINLLFSFLFIFIISQVKAQSILIDTFNNGTQKKYVSDFELLSTHPLGIFISRIDQNFQICPPKHIMIQFSIGNGNVWLPLVKAYRPEDPKVRDYMEKIIWHERWDKFNLQEMPSDSVQFEADGVIRMLKANIRFRISEKHELGMTIRSILFTKGKFPFSILTNDQIIESFHSGIAGGNDPFARKYYGYDKANLKYIDENGKSIELKNGDYMVPGVEAHYYYYPEFNCIRNLYFNVGAHLGANISRYNPSLDFGLSTSALKIFTVSAKTDLCLGIGVNALRQHLIETGEIVSFSNQKYIFGAEGQFEYIKRLKDEKCITIAINYSIQRAYNDSKENNYQVLTGERISTHWHYALSHLYRPLETWNLIFSYSKKYSFSLYIKEDFNVNNAPDVQTGLNLQIPILRKK